jgi:hypothetical protein
MANASKWTKRKAAVLLPLWLLLAAYHACSFSLTYPSDPSMWEVAGFWILLWCGFAAGVNFIVLTEKEQQ